MDLELKNKVVLVMASSKGIGKAIASKYSEEGATVIVTGRNEATLKNTANEIAERTGNEVVPYVTDVSKHEDIMRLYEYIKKRFDVLDVLVCNAGGPPIIDFETSDENDWYDAFQLTLMSSVRSIKAAIPLMKKNGEGRIVYIASTSVKEPISELLLSNVFRSGVQALCKSLATDYAKDQILINVVGPGKVETDRLINLDKKKAEQNNLDLHTWQDRNQKSIPMERYATPDEFADGVIFLGSYRNTYITGQTLLIDGGIVKSY